MSISIEDKQIPEMIPELERGPDWLREIRQSAKESYNNTPLPQRGLHFWRYTDPVRFIFDREKMSDTSFGENYDRVEKIELENLAAGHLIALITDKGGREIKIHGKENLEKAGVIVSPLSEAVKTHTDLVNEYLYKLVNNDTGKFEAMNGALWNDGIFIHIPDKITIEKPIHLLRESGLSGSAQFPRLLIVAGKNSEVTIIDEYGGGSVDREKGQSYTNSAVEIYGKADSRTRYIMLQRMTSAAVSYFAHRAYLEQNATMLTIPLAFGAELSKSSFGVSLNGQGADSNMYGLLFGNDRQHFDNHTTHHHASGRTTSDINFKVVVADKAQSAYTGLIKIEHDAKTCEAYQENRNLLLSSKCKAETIPELEILNEDVMCSHGATLGPIDPEMIFYLKCRGIKKAEAVRMIVSGFVADTFKRVPQDVRQRLTGYVETRLENI